MANEVRVKGIVSWTYPYFGNNHVMPYGVLLVTDGVDEKACRTKGDRWMGRAAVHHLQAEAVPGGARGQVVLGEVQVGAHVANRVTGCPRSEGPGVTS